MLHGVLTSLNITNQHWQNPEAVCIADDVSPNLGSGSMRAVPRQKLVYQLHFQNELGRTMMVMTLS